MAPDVNDNMQEIFRIRFQFMCNVFRLSFHYQLSRNSATITSAENIDRIHQVGEGDKRRSINQLANAISISRERSAKICATDLA